MTRRIPGSGGLDETHWATRASWASPQAPPEPADAPRGGVPGSIDKCRVRIAPSPEVGGRSVFGFTLLAAGPPADAPCGRRAQPPARRGVARRPLTPPRRGEGFTLAELLVVMMIIAILAGILTPAVIRATRQPRVVECRGFVRNLAMAAEHYRQDHRGQYPGQDYTSWRDGYTGSQVLAASVFGYVTPRGADPYVRAGRADPNARSEYAGYREGALATLDGRRNALADRFPRGKAVAYDPSRRVAASARVGEKYTYADNAEHTRSTAAAFAAGIADPRGGPTACRREGAFLLIAPGADRNYFTGDDVVNWTR